MAVHDVGVTVVVLLLLLLALFGSGCVPLALAESVSVPGIVGVTTMVGKKFTMHRSSVQLQVTDAGGWRTRSAVGRRGGDVGRVRRERRGQDGVRPLRRAAVEQLDGEGDVAAGEGDRIGRAADADDVQVDLGVDRDRSAAGVVGVVRIGLGRRRRSRRASAVPPAVGVTTTVAK